MAPSLWWSLASSLYVWWTIRLTVFSLSFSLVLRSRWLCMHALLVGYRFSFGTLLVVLRSVETLSVSFSPMVV